MTRSICVSLALFRVFCGADHCPSSTVEKYPDKASVDAIAKEAEESPNKLAALGALKQIATNRDRNPRTRQYALLKISDLAIDHELFVVSEFFLDVLKNEGNVDPDGALQHIAFLQYSKLQVYQEDGTEAQNAVLQSLLTVEYDIARTPTTEQVDPTALPQEVMTKAARNYAREWAAEELCNRGDDQNSDAVFRVLRGTHDSELRIRLCEAKTKALRVSPDRLSALRSTLARQQTDSEARDAGDLFYDRLESWVIEEIAKIDGSRPEDALLSYMLKRKSSADLGEATERKLVSALVGRGWSAERLKETGFSQLAIMTAGGYSQ